MRHSFTIAQTEHTLWLERARGAYRMHLDDRAPVIALEQSPETATLHIDGEQYDVAVAVDGDQVHIHLDAGTWTVQYTDPVQRHAHHGASSADDVARAPMPGVVIAVHAAEGGTVARGDTLLVIESMKLETAIKAWRDGTVAAIHVAIGQTFDRTAPLVTLVPEAES